MSAGWLTSDFYNFMSAAFMPAVFTVKYALAHRFDIS